MQALSNLSTPDCSALLYCYSDHPILSLCYITAWVHIPIPWWHCWKSHNISMETTPCSWVNAHLFLAKRWKLASEGTLCLSPCMKFSRVLMVVTIFNIMYCAFIGLDPTSFSNGGKGKRRSPFDHQKRLYWGLQDLQGQNPGGVGTIGRKWNGQHWDKKLAEFNP